MAMRVSGRPLRFLLLLLLACVPKAPALEDLPLRDSAVAERYAQWAKNAMEKGQWSEALAGLERAADFADVSSDISYLLALARLRQTSNRRAVLEALDRALYLNRWRLFDSDAARLLRAETLIAVRAYDEALAELSRVNRSPEEAALTLRALSAFRPDQFLSNMTGILDRYPRHTAPVRVFFAFLANEAAAGRKPEAADLELLELVIRRLPALLLNDAELAWMAAPFMRDSAQARRLVLAYRAVNSPVPASLPAALRFEALGEEAAVEELFAGEETVDMTLLSDVWELLRTEEAKALFTRNLSAFNGVITEDSDRDGIAETFAEYSEGMLALYAHDADQDGAPDLTIFFEAGDPRRALALLPPGSGNSRAAAEIRWERYPAIQEVELDGVLYIPRPFEFHFSPVGFVDLWGSGLLFPEKDTLTPPLTRRVLVTSVYRVERPSLEFSGGIEIIELAQGIPVRAREYVGNLKVSETEFLRGRPQLQRLDLDFDGNVDTVRRFSRPYRPMEIDELWDYDRDIEDTTAVSNLEIEW